jgi:hypothetical protein
MRLPQNAPFEHRDSAESMFVERALTWIETEVYNTLTPLLEGRLYVPVDNSVGPGAKFTAYKQYTRSGMAKIITERGGDLPTAKIDVQEFHHQFYRLGMSYEYTLDDLLAAQMSAQNGGPAINVDMELSIGCREGIEKALDNISAIGSADPTSTGITGLNGVGPDVGLLGLLNLPNATLYSVASGASGSTLWSQKTPDEVVRDLTGIFKAQVSGTYKVHTPNSILMPIDQYEDIAGRRMGDGSDETVLSFFQKINKRVKTIDSWQFCTGAGVGSTDRMVAYNRDKRFVRHMISQEFTQMPAQYEKFEFSVDCTAKSAGVICPWPLSVSFGDGI